MGNKGSASSPAAEAPRRQWTMLVANMHEYKLVIDDVAQTISVLEIKDGAQTIVATTSLLTYVSGGSAAEPFLQTAGTCRLSFALEDAKVSSQFYLKK